MHASLSQWATLEVIRLGVNKLPCVYGTEPEVHATPQVASIHGRQIQTKHALLPKALKACGCNQYIAAAGHRKVMHL